MKVGDLIKCRYNAKPQIGIVVKFDPGDPYLGVVWATDDGLDVGSRTTDTITYHHILDLVPLNEDKKCPGGKHTIDYITNTWTKES